MYCIEGIPFIIRFKTDLPKTPLERIQRIEGIPFIIRFKTELSGGQLQLVFLGIEGIPFIIRFKTMSFKDVALTCYQVLKVFHL